MKSLLAITGLIFFILSTPNAFAEEPSTETGPDFKAAAEDLSRKGGFSAFVNSEAASDAGRGPSALLLQTQEIRAEQRQREAQMTWALVAATAVGLAVIAFIGLRRRQRIADWWFGRSRGLRTWVLGSIAWAGGTAIFVLLADPYNAGTLEMVYWDEDRNHMILVMALPPAFLGALWYVGARLLRR